MALAQQQTATNIHLQLLSRPDGSAAEPGPDRILNGYVLVDESLLEDAERIEIQYRGVEVVGGTLDDFEDDTLDGLHPRKGVRAFNKVYFDERLVVWQRDDTDPAGAARSPDGTSTKFEFSIAFPHANYPAEIKSICKAAPSQSFEIAYHAVGWVFGADDTLVARSVTNVPFIPLLTRRPSIAPQVPVTQTAYDDRGRECLFTRVTLSQTDYIPGDQVVGGVYIECVKSNRTVRKAECQLRQRVECRMRRTFNSAETAELVSTSRPQSSQPSAHSDDSDVLWMRTVDIGLPQVLTLTTSGVGLAAAAAANTAGASSSLTGSITASSVSLASDSCNELVEKRESTFARAMGPKGSGIISGYRSCSANVHTHIPSTASVVPGHFLLFSYELLIDVTVSSLARGSQKLSTRTPLSSMGSTTPNSAVGFTLSKSQATGPSFRALAAQGSGSNGCFSATAACFPQNAQSGAGGLLDGREKAQLKGNRFSVGAFQGGTGSSADSTDAEVLSARYSTLKSAPIHRAITQSSADEQGDVVEMLPNAVELLRFKYDTSLVVVPKIFVSSALDGNDEGTQAVGNTSNAGAATAPADAVVDDGQEPPNVGTCSKETASVAEQDSSRKDVVSVSAVADGASSTPSPQPSVEQAAGDSGSPAAAFVAVAQPAPLEAVEADNNSKADDEKSSRTNADTASEPPARGASGGSSEYDLARAVYAAAEKVLNDKEWDRPNSIYLAVEDKKKKKLHIKPNVAAKDTKGKVKTTRQSLSSEESDSTEDLDVERAISRLAPTKRAPQSRSSSLAELAGVKDIISGIDFFGTESSNGPELTGLLSADPDKLVFGVTLGALEPSSSVAESDTVAAERIASGVTAYSPLVDGEGGRAWGKQQPQINSVLRRSMSMPGASLSTAKPADSSSSTAHAGSPGSTVARSAFEAGDKSLVRRNYLVRNERSSGADANLADMSPRSMISAVSSTSRLGPRVGVFKTISHRFTSWFTKK
ncbi:hypothetical protein GGI25_006138 [Coemansia spiralis]|uniref:Uncharacterized protein n=2 Tax=Coemansia TaxID=4863 RepID=A0A9W8G3D7_9FUNG|nr:hypothetical protein EDC05_006098 [Coemansia umbellata]KAJ2618948.1 hypothetical protein GGI26_006233 [Coemansia sp. RSA 1358]KAJ2669491.1 hypothetical protein GGI25_006138 [Coemansia spiralis]